MEQLNNNNNNTIWGGSVLTGEEPAPHSGELKHALPQAGGPTQSQQSRPMSSGHHISMEHRLLRNSDTNASNKKKFERNCERTQYKTCRRHNPQTVYDAPQHTDQHGTSWRSDVPPPCLGGASHGWVPVNTHGTPVLTSVRRPWVAQPRPRTHASDTRRETRSASSKDAVHPNVTVEQGW